MEISVNQSIAFALAMKQANVQGNFQTAVFNKAVDAFESEAELMAELVSEVEVDMESVAKIVDILV